LALSELFRPPDTALPPILLSFGPRRLPCPNRVIARGINRIVIGWRLRRLCQSVVDVTQGHPTSLRLRFENAAGAAGITAMLVGVLVLAGWIFRIEVLKRGLPDLKATNPLTAFGFMLAGLALLLRRRSIEPVVVLKARTIGAGILASMVLVIGLIELAAHAFGLFGNALRFGPEANQMAPNTALGFCLLGLSLLVLDVTTRANARPAEFAAALLGLISLLGLFGYAYQVPTLYAVSGFTPMALPTAIASFVLAVGILCARPNLGFMALATSDGVSGLLIRRLFPTMVLALFALGWLRLEGERRGLYSSELGVALYTLANVLIFGALVWWSASTLHRLEAEHQRAAEARDQAWALNRLIMENSLDVICVLDRDGRFIEVSAASNALWGYAPSELVGRSYAGLVHPDDLARSVEAAQLVTSGQPLVDFSNRYLRKDGRAVGVDWTATWSERDGLMFCIARDATRRNQFEKQLRDSEERFRMLVANVKDYAILMLDVDGNVATWNAGAERIKGYKADEIIGRHFSIFYPREDVERGKPEKGLRIASKEGRFEDEGWRVRKDGSQFLADVVITAMRDQAGELRGFSKVTRDITERKQAEKELESFTYSVSHDLRAPLRHINGYARILQEDAAGQLDQQMRRYLDAISTSARTMGTLIDDLLAFSRLGRQPVERTHVDMNVLTERALVELSDENAGDPRVHVSVLPAAQGDPALLRQVWVNLLSNALKYSARRGDAARVEVSGERDGEVTRYRVRDNGVGFDMRYVDKLFGVFQRLHSQEEFEGTGVGLAIVQRIVSRHGGRVWAEGEREHGATFTFELPAAAIPVTEEMA
jgi:PAS domain S-box-containing protein